jgi:formylglycine-generating enzyme required for sulfatase activity
MISMSLLAVALFEAGKILVEKGIIDPALEKGLTPLSEWLTRGYDQKKAELELQKAFYDAIKLSGAPVNDDDALINWLKEVGLSRLQANNNHSLRRLVAQSIISFTDPNSPPPDDLVRALSWPQNRKSELSSILSNLRMFLAKLEEWQPLISYADSAAKQGNLKKIISQLADLNNLMVWADNGKALRVVVEKMGLSQNDAAIIERRYRDDLIKELYWHSFRGIVQVKKDIRLPLSNIYLELSVFELQNKEEQTEVQFETIELDLEGRFRLDEISSLLHISDILTKERKLVVLGDPGTGKTISLRYIALMVANGGGAINLGLNEPLIPIFVRLADFARELEKRPFISLENFLIEYIQLAHSSSDRLGEFLRLSLEQGKCMLLLDGLDEVATNMRLGKISREGVVKAVQKLSDIRCNDNCCNRMIVTSRIEGYWDDPLLDFKHIQLCPLRIPDEVESFLFQWYLAHEQAHDREIDLKRAELLANERVNELLPRMLSNPSVCRLATNPLLLTILALINENLGRLPNRRIKLYEIAVQTLIESWRQLQVGLPDSLIGELGEDMIIRIMAPLAYWMHENHPGGTTSFEEWHNKLLQILINEGFEQEAEDLANRFLYHARFQTGLLTEKSLNQFGFFHLTFEEYLTARQIARQREDERRRMLKMHWADPRWQEVILLTAGQLGIAESKTDDVSVFIEDILKMEAENEEQKGYPAILGGRALEDIGVRSVTAQTRRWVHQSLLSTAQDLNLDTNKPSNITQFQILVRNGAADILNGLGYFPDDLYTFVRNRGFWIGKYPVTNLQYQRFVESPDYMNPELWQDFPMFDETSKLMPENWMNKGIEWRKDFLPISQDYSPHTIYPKYWEDVRLGIFRKNVPVVGISWYEANAYCKWLEKHWAELPECSNELLKPSIIRLPTAHEWEHAAGGTQSSQRYAWDKPGETSSQINDILRCANLRENKLGFTTAVWMFPAGTSPNNVMDLTGNVWEWQANFSHQEHTYLALRGGSWNTNKELAYVGYHFYFHPFDRSSSVGFRLIIPSKQDNNI